jgi:small nuclear ribonucleoprotein (snRNP)-like protein
MNSMFAKDRDYVRMNFMSFKDRDIGQETSKVGRFGEKLSKEDDIGTPLKLLHEGEGHRVTVELKNGDKCRGTLIESENNWTSQLEDITYISRKVHPFLLESKF